MEESQESKDVIISLPVLMNMPEETITKQKGAITPFWEMKRDTKIIHIKLREIHTPASEATYQNSEMTLVLRRP